MKLEEVFNNVKFTENGDIAYNSTLNTFIDILFMSEFYQKNLNKTPELDNSEFAKLFAMFIRDPRYGLGRRDLGRKLLKDAEVSFENIVKCGRYDDLWHIFKNKTIDFYKMLDYLYDEIKNNNNELAKKWMPRYASKDREIARNIASYWFGNLSTINGERKRAYGKFIKSNTVENNLSRKNTEAINFEHVPSLAMLKYYKRFKTGKDTAIRFEKYLEDVKSGKSKLNVSVTNVYDIYKYRNTLKEECDTFFDKIEKISGSWLPIVDTSGSMQDSNDSFGKACSIGHYLAKCSTYAPNKVVSFSSRPQLIDIAEDKDNSTWPYRYSYKNTEQYSEYHKEIARMYTGDCSNTDFGAVMKLLANLGKDAPEYLVVLSDMEFDYGSNTSKKETMDLFKRLGVRTKIVWWNFNSRATTCPETDKDGNIFISGYNPMLLKFLNVGFDAKKFLVKLLKEYYNNIK